MNIAVIDVAIDANTPILLPARYCEARWYAAYTSANREKRVSEHGRVHPFHYLRGNCLARLLGLGGLAFFASGPAQH